jgi:cytochrome c oxidase subunit 2
MIVLPDLARHALGLPVEATPTAASVDSLHAAVITTTLVGTACVAAVTFVFVLRYRRTREAPAATPRIVASGFREWLTASAVLALFVGFWAVGYVQYTSIERPPSGTLVVYVTAKQWMWQFTYADGRSSEDVLVVRAGTPFELVMTSRDVIHSFFVPSFRIKQDTIPGRWVTLYVDAAAPGSYPIYCAEFCGVAHSHMLGEVRVLDEADYAVWEREATHDGYAARGREVAASHGCLSCHALDGQKRAGPSFAGLYGSRVPLDDGRVVIADEAYLTHSIVDPLADRVAGYPAMMPSYHGQLSAEETGALLELIRSLRDTLPTQGRVP